MSYIFIAPFRHGIHNIVSIIGTGHFYVTVSHSSWFNQAAVLKLTFAWFPRGKYCFSQSVFVMSSQRVPAVIKQKLHKLKDSMRVSGFTYWFTLLCFYSTAALLLLSWHDDIKMSLGPVISMNISSLKHSTSRIFKMDLMFFIQFHPKQMTEPMSSVGKCLQRTSQKTVLPV